jgi:hypothetical protein
VLVLATGQVDDSERVLYARARPEFTKITETYRYQQEISRNPSLVRAALPTGRITLAVPYDGHEHFSREACSDVAAGLTGDEDQQEAVIGHLLFANHGRTDLGDVLQLNDGYKSVPIRVPVAGAPAPDGGGDGLHSDRYTCEISYDYTPGSGAPRLMPIHVSAELLDPDSIDFPDITPVDLDKKETRELEAVVAKITQQGSFRSHLLLCLTVLVDVSNVPERGATQAEDDRSTDESQQPDERDDGQEAPERIGGDQAQDPDEPDDDRLPKITRVSLHWPTITSLRALRLFVDGERRAVKYNPMTQHIEWTDVAMSSSTVRNPGDADTDVLTYHSRTMYLRIEQPGELYEQVSIDGCVEVEIPGHLLSGLEARLYDATGTMMRSKRQPQLVSKVSTELRLILDDAFARRTLSPYQHLYFEEIIPDEIRFVDIKTALTDRGFDIRFDKSVSDDQVRQLIVATKSEGPDTMALWMVIEGNRYKTRRQDHMPGGQIYTSAFESGDLKIFVRGALPGESREITHEINSLQRALRERFDRLRARR